MLYLTVRYTPLIKGVGLKICDYQHKEVAPMDREAYGVCRSEMIQTSTVQ
jgi:hypothetical protein